MTRGVNSRPFILNVADVIGGAALQWPSVLRYFQRFILQKG